MFSVVVCATVAPMVLAQQSKDLQARTKRYGGTTLKQVPREFTRRKPSRTRAPGDGGVIRQTDLLTGTYNPTTPQLQPLLPSRSQDQHPAWTADERYIYFDSDRISEVNSNPTSPEVFNIFRMNSDGSGVTQVFASDSVNKIEPAISADSRRLAYVSGGTASFDGNLGFSTNGFKLFVVVLNGGAPVDLSSAKNDGDPFVDVRRPTWASGGNEIAFSGRVASNPSISHIYKVNIDTGVITQITRGVSNDYSPAWSPDGRLIAFTSNATAFSATGPITSATTKSNDDLWIVAPTIFAPNAKKITDFAVGAVASSNRNPSWSTVRGSRDTFLAFASTRFDSANDGVADSVGTTTDIYFLFAAVVADISSPGGGFTVDPETVGNAAIKLQTSTRSDQGIDPNEPSANFDPTHSTNEDFPAWPQFINSFRIAYQSNRGNNLNLWASTVNDLNAPTLIRYDLSTGSILGVVQESGAGTPRAGNDASSQVHEFSAGSPIRVRARLADYETGVESVYLQIKNPNSSTQEGGSGNEHKTFYAQNTNIDMTTAILNVPYEYECQAINPTTYGYKNDGAVGPGLTGYLGRIRPAGTVPGNWPGFNKYFASLDDTDFYPGTPDADFWLQMYDDGPVSTGGHEPEGETKGDGIYTTKWTTPGGQPSDWYLDVIAIDRIGNWKIYDNVWGFTTLPFVARGTMLYVNDYDIGQKFFQNQINNTSFDARNIDYTGIPTESWMTNIRNDLQPTAYISGTTGGAVLGLFQTLGPHSYGDSRAFPYYFDLLIDNDAEGPITQKYDQWRILSRGPIPNSVLEFYSPYLETQPADTTVANPVAKTVTVAEKCVIWHSPYSGNVFAGNGTISDAKVQNQLLTYMRDKGLRVFLSGQDVAFSLTLRDPTSGASPLLHDRFGVDFVRDFPGGAFPFPVIPNPDNVINLTGGRAAHPISTEYWFGGNDHNYYDYVPPAPRAYSPPSAGSIYTYYPDGTTFKAYGANNNFSPDVISFVAEVPNIAGVDGRFGGNGGPVIVWRTIPGTPEQRAVFSSIAWESINPEFYTGGGTVPPRISRGRRAEMMHNVGDYLRTGRVFGIIRDVNGNTPIKGVLVKVTDNYSGFVGTAISQSDGSYTITGLIPDNIYEADGYRPGYIATHIDRVLFHGATSTRVDLFMQQGQNGSIAGTVTVAGTNPAVPISGAIITATDSITGQVFSATTGIDGKYVIQNVPVLSDPTKPLVGYTVVVSNLTALGYGSSIPPSYLVPVTASSTGRDVIGKDFQLKPLPGSIQGKVTRRNSADVDTGSGIGGATVTAISGMTTLTALTNDDGTYSIPNADPGAWQVYATAPGFKNSDPVSVQVTTNVPTLNVNFALFRELPGSLSGLVTNSSGGVIIGATVTLTDAAGNPLKDADGVVVPSVTTTAIVTRSNDTSYNYIFNKNVPAGTGIKVTATKSGYTSKTGTLTVDVVKDVEKKNVNFILQPLASFSQSKQLVSAPYTYSVSLPDLLNLSAGERTNVKFYAWDNEKYIKYPTPPANTFVRGRGYWLFLDAPPADLTQTPAGPLPDETKPFEIQLKPGWNLIGDPFTFSIDFQKVRVRDGGVEKSILVAQSETDPAIGGALWTFEVGQYQVAYSLDPFLGYWIKASREVTLIIDPTGRTGKAGSQVSVSNVKGDGWTLELRADASGVRSVPGIIGVHRSAKNGFDRFKLETPPSAGDGKDVSLTFNHEDWGNQSGRYSKDVRSMASLTQTWDFTVQSNVANSPVVLTWPAISTVPGKNNVQLIDLDNKTTINLRNRASYQVSGTNDTVNRHFRLEVKRENRKKLQLSDLVAQVNGTPSRGAASVSISYTLSSAANVQVVILQGGRRIRTLEPNRSRAEGVAELTWDMKNEGGNVVSGNVYTVEVKASDETGYTTRKVGTIVITR